MKLWMVWLIGFLFTWGYFIQGKYNATQQFEFPELSYTIAVGVCWPVLLGSETCRVVNHFVPKSGNDEDIEDNGDGSK